ncbi:hypothetical protein V1514DRAFT_319497 [Lipomyces japonicus]|uniref:uncharacterized protein n=1 Tax=Lipomyces japonicus TaxID=56871 RepID=UPI0034D01856
MANAENDDSTIPSNTKSDLSQTLSRIAITSLPAWGFSAALLATLPRARSVSNYFPRPGSCVGFAAALGLGGYVVYDQDIINGAGFSSAWSTIYLIVNGKRAVTQLRPWPVVLSLFALGNAGIYGREFFFPDINRTKI